MKSGIILLVILLGLTGCEDKSAAKKAGSGISTIYIFGDDLWLGDNSPADVIAATEGKPVKNMARPFDGSNAAMISGIQQLSQWGDRADIQPGDEVIYSAGIYDAKWNGAQDPSNQAHNRLIGFMREVIAHGASHIYITTVPRLPLQGYTTGFPINNGTNAAMDFYSNVIRSAVAEINDPRVELVDLSTYTDAAYWLPNGFSLSRQGRDELASEIAK